MTLSTPGLVFSTFLPHFHFADAFAEIQVEDKAGEKVGAGEEEVKGGAQEKFIKGGSQLRLNCHLRKATESPAYIFWYHNKTMVNYSPDLGRAVYTHQDGMGSTLTVSSDPTKMLLNLDITLEEYKFCSTIYVWINKFLGTEC